MKLKIKTVVSVTGGAAMAMLFAPGALAQEVLLPEVAVRASGPTEGGYAVAESAAATKTDIPLRDVPQIVNAVPKALLRDQNALSVQDALQNIPGLGFSVGDGQRDQVAIRGFTAITDQFIDGVRDDALYFRDLSNIERIEVLKGPASVVYGRGSAGGLVNRVSKKPVADPVSELAATIGSEGERRGEFDVGAASADRQRMFRLTGAVEDSHSFRNQYFRRRSAIAPSASFLLRPGSLLTVQFDYLKDKRLADQGVPSYRGRPVDVPIETYYGAANGAERAFVQSDVKSATVTLDHAIGSTLTLHSIARIYDYALDRNYTSIGAISSGAAPTVSIGQTRRLRDENGIYFQNELSQSAQWGGVGNQLMYGLEIGRQNKGELLWSRPNAALYDLFAPVLVNLPALPPSLVASNDSQQRIDIAGLYLQDLVTFDPHWKALAGVRFDRLKQVRDDRTARNLDLDRTDHTIAPRVGVIYQPGAAIAWYAAYSKSIQPLADAFSFRANSDALEPTRTVNREIGFKLDLGAKAKLTAALFDMSQTNIQVADPANSTLSLAVGKQRTRGIETGLNGTLWNRWDVAAGYAFMDGKIVESTELTSARTPFKGNVSALTPRHSANLWIKRRFDHGLYAAVGGRAESARFASPDNLTTLPGFGVIHLGAGYDTRRYGVAVTLTNLLDRKYFASAHGGANDYNMPGAPRSLLVTGRYRF
jgi:catecholate siderophore receptor